MKCRGGACVAASPISSRLVLLLLVVALTIPGCGSASDPDGQAGPVESTGSFRQRSAVSADGEAADAAATRLFAEIAAMKIADGQDLDIFEGATAGPPLAFTEGYEFPYPVPAPWVEHHKFWARPKSFFAEMVPAPVHDDWLLVPILKDGRTPASFDIYLDDAGHWQYGGLNYGDYLGGYFGAQSRLVDALGEGTDVRTAIFLPSGMFLAVGRNGEDEAAVYLAWVDDGPGVRGFSSAPEYGTLYTPDEVALLVGYSDLLTPLKALVIVRAGVVALLVARAFVLRRTRTKGAGHKTGESLS